MGMRCVLIGSLCGYISGRHYEGSGCVVCISNDNAGYNPLVKHLTERSRIGCQGYGCTHCCLCDRSACTNGCSTACHGYIVLNSFPNSVDISFGGDGDLFTGLFLFAVYAADCPSLKLVSFGSAIGTIFKCKLAVFLYHIANHCAGAAVGVVGNYIFRDIFPNSRYDSIGRNSNFVANCLFIATNKPSFEALSVRCSESASRQCILTGNIVYIGHRTRTAISRKGYSIISPFPSNSKLVTANRISIFVCFKTILICGFGSKAGNGTGGQRCAITNRVPRVKT